MTISLERNSISRERNNISRERNIIARERNIVFRGNAIIYVFHMTFQGLRSISKLSSCVSVRWCFIEFV